MVAQKEIFVCRCKECGNVLSYSLYPQTKTKKQYCYLCILNFTEFAEVLTPRKFPTKHDVFAATEEHNPLQLIWRTNTIKVLEKLRVWKEQIAIKKLMEERNK